MRLAILIIGMLIILTSCSNITGENQTVISSPVPTEAPAVRSEFVSPYAGNYVTQSSERRKIYFESQNNIFIIHSAKELKEHFLETRFNNRLVDRDRQLLAKWGDEFFTHNYLVVTAPIFDQRSGRFGGILEDGQVVFYRFPPPSSEYATTADFQSYSHLIALSNDFRPDEFEWVWVRRE